MPTAAAALILPACEAAMPLGCLQRLAPFATAFLFLAAATDFRSPAQADDPAPAYAAHEAAVLNRIFANWKARHDRVRSLHFVYDSRTTYKKGSPDPLSPRVTPLEHDEVYDQFGAQLWMEGDDRVCWIETPKFKLPQAMRTDVSRVTFRSAIVGKTAWWYDTGPSYETGGAPSPAVPPHALLYPAGAQGRMFPDPQLQALLLTFRPEHSAVVTWRKDQCRLVSEHAAVDNGQYVEFQRVVPREGRFEPRREEACWVSPGRDDVVVHWRIEMPGLRLPPAPTCVGTIKYKKDKTYDWIPSEWTCEYVGRDVSEFKVTSYAINEKIDASVFSQEVPPGTPVGDQRSRPARYYIVQQDGSKRTISSAEYIRLIEAPVRGKKQAAAKGQAK
jgi:hypothetical protein